MFSVAQYELGEPHKNHEGNRTDFLNGDAFGITAGAIMEVGDSAFRCLTTVPRWIPATIMCGNFWITSHFNTEQFHIHIGQKGGKLQVPVAFRFLSAEASSS